MFEKKSYLRPQKLPLRQIKKRCNYYPELMRQLLALVINCQPLGRSTIFIFVNLNVTHLEISVVVVQVNTM